LQPLYSLFQEIVEGLGRTINTFYYEASNNFAYVSFLYFEGCNFIQLALRGLMKSVIKSFIISQKMESSISTEQIRK